MGYTSSYYLFISQNKHLKRKTSIIIMYNTVPRGICQHRYDDFWDFDMNWHGIWNGRYCLFFFIHLIFLGNENAGTIGVPRGTFILIGYSKLSFLLFMMKCCVGINATIRFAGTVEPNRISLLCYLCIGSRLSITSAMDDELLLSSENPSKLLARCRKHHNWIPIFSYSITVSISISMERSR